MTKQILIIGGNGFLGYNLAKKLSKLNYHLFLLCKNKSYKLKPVKNAKYIFCDILEKKNLSVELNREFTYVINLSGNIDHRNKVQTLQTHFFGLKNLINALKNFYTSRIKFGIWQSLISTTRTKKM